MKKKSKNNKIFLFYYQFVLAVAGIYIFFTDLDVYLYNAGIGPPPKLFSMVFFAASIPLFLSLFAEVNNFYSLLGIISWICLYLGISLFSILQTTQSEKVLQEFDNRILAVIFILVMISIFSRYPIIQIWARRAISSVGILNVFNNITELINPLAFGGVNLTGRPAGFYIDPNKTGCSLILSLIFSIGVIPPKYRIPFALVIGVGVLITFSRGSILSWLIIVTVLIIQGKISRNQLLYWGMITGVVIILITTLGIGSLSTGGLEDSLVLNDNMLGRLAWLQDPSAADANKDNSRLEVVEFAWKKFKEHPWVGNGIAYTQEWGEIRTHNMYLFLMVEHGYFAMLLMPLFILAVTHHAKSESKDIALNFAPFMMLWGIFSHRVFEERYILIIFSLMAAMRMSSVLEPDSKTGEKS